MRIKIIPEGREKEMSNVGVNTERLVKTFCELVRTDSTSGNERQMADLIKKKLEEMGYRPEEDNAGETIGGNAGNVIVKVPGNTDAPPLLFMAHMDTVEPGKGKTPVISGDIIKSDGTTVLGGDDLAGCACILEAINVLNEQKVPHGDVYAVFSIAEETGLCGAKALDVFRVPAKYAFVLDEGGPIGTVAVKAPYHNKIRFIVRGKAAHAGVCPEEGINAVRAAARAVASLPFMGRIDEESTCNIGIIKGGRATNIVPDEVVLDGELRSISEEKLEKYTNEWVKSFRNSVEAEKALVEIEVKREYGGYSISEDHPIMGLLKKATAVLNLPLLPVKTGGGSDTNVLNTKGIPAVNLSVGMTNVHGTNEQISVSDMTRATELILEIIKANAGKEQKNE
ncbi:M20/M25/M40 family metallo-hydrolase [Thermoclostridium stercorarium]|nr:M20/M25/M40 family metallo-hydrolase [Thermoclostridium stercorarium]